MANGPVQVVLNSDSFITDVPVRKTPVIRKDFYANNNLLFASHKTNVVSQIKEIGKSISDNPFSRIGYVKVRLIRAAMAKSHRPVSKILTERNSCSVVGGTFRGELIIKSNAEALIKLASLINDNAETHIRTHRKTNGEIEIKPSVWRTELGAIESFSLYTETDKIISTNNDISEWLKSDGSIIYVDLFEEPVAEQLWDTIDNEQLKMHESFKRGLEQIAGIRVFKSRINCTTPTIVCKITNLPNSLVSLNHCAQRREMEVESCSDITRYVDFIDFLKSHPLVRNIRLVPSLQSITIPSFNIDHTDIFPIPTPLDNKRYPLVGVVDGGIAHIFDLWKSDEWDNIIPKWKNESHGSFIAGLLVSGATLNPTICKESDGCLLADACVIPDLQHKDLFNRCFPCGLDDFFSEIESAVIDLKARTGARIFNLSINIEKDRNASDYSDFAKILDRIAEENDVIFVVSAGNKKGIRTEWSTDVAANINQLNNGTNDIIYAPAESVRNISVGALNPDFVGLASYTCKGKGSSIMVKPDVVYASGRGCHSSLDGTGLLSVDINSKIYSNAGTSFSTPIISKTLACLDNAIEGNTSRETLMALLIHNSEVPEFMKNRAYKNLLKDSIGYGVPSSSSQMLNGDEHSITLVFAGRIKNKKILSFSFGWPQSLIKDGRCRGKVKLTLVSTPAIDYTYGDEMIRENVHVALRMQQKDGTKKSQLKSLYRDDRESESIGHLYEWQLVETEQKWNPIKVYEREFKSVMNQGPWFLEIEYESRTTMQYSTDGVPFTAILTIGDPNNNAPVYNEMRQAVIATGAQIADIQTAVTITQRV